MAGCAEDTNKTKASKLQHICIYTCSMSELASWITLGVMPLEFGILEYVCIKYLCFLGT